MKGYVCLFLLLVGTAAFAQSKSPDEAAVLSLQQQWLEASQKADDEALRQIIDDSFVGSTPNNHIINKQTLVSASAPSFTNTHFFDLKASVIGDTAVVFGNLVTPGNPTALRCAMVYTKRAGTWRMIAAQLVPVMVTKD